MNIDKGSFSSLHVSWLNRSAFIKPFPFMPVSITFVWYSLGRKKVDESLANSHIDDNAKRVATVPPPPPPLELCCMSGCQNCVMIQHAEALMRFYDDDTVAKAAIEEIPDENLKAFLRMELNLK